MSISRQLVFGIPTLEYHTFVKKKKKNRLSKPIGYQTEIFPRQNMKGRTVLNSVRVCHLLVWSREPSHRYKVYFILSPSIFISESWTCAYCSKIKIIYSVKYDKTNVCVSLNYLSGKTFQKDLPLCPSFKEQTFFRNGLVTHGPLPLSCLFLSFWTTKKTQVGNVKERSLPMKNDTTTFFKVLHQDY